MNSPYGGKLVSRYIASESQRDMSGLPRVRMSETAISDLYNIAEGVFRHSNNKYKGIKARFRNIGKGRYCGRFGSA